jgi:hypothetical protein
METSSPCAASINLSWLSKDLRAIQSLEIIERKQMILICIVHSEHVLSMICGFFFKIEVVDLFKLSLAKEAILVDIISC